MNQPDDNPKTLLLAKNRIQELNEQLETLRGKSSSVPIGTAPIGAPKRPAPKLADASSGPTYPTDGSLSTPGATRLSPTPMKVSHPMPERKALPPELDTPVKIQKVLDLTNIETIRELLGNPVHSRLQKACLYNELKARRALLGD